MRDVAIVAFAQSNVERDERSAHEIADAVVAEALRAAGVERESIAFACAGARANSEVGDASVAMDGAWVLHDAWTRLQRGEIDAALVYAFDKTEPDAIAALPTVEIEPYGTAPLWPDHAPSARQAQQGIDAGLWSEARMAEIVIANLSHAADNPHSVRRGDFKKYDLLNEPYVAEPLRERDCPARCDGATAMLVVAAERAAALCERPVWIRGIAHASEGEATESRDLLHAPSARAAAVEAGLAADRIDFAEVTAPYSHQELIVRDALALDAGVLVNPSGGSLGAHTPFGCGLNRIGDAATRIALGHGDRAVAHAAQGACLAQNLVIVLEGA